MNDETLLAAIYRGRPETIGDVAALTHLPAGDADAAVQRLRDRGLLGGDGDALTYTHPASWVADTATARSAQLRRNADDALSAMERMVSELPGLLRHWSVGEASADLVPVVIRHGLHASEDLWYDTASHDSGTLHAVLPEVDRFLTSEPERAVRFGRALAGKERVRVIMPTWAADDTIAIQRMTHYRAAGVEYRLLDSPPSWFWVDADQLAVPFEWGEGRPTSVLGVRHASLAGMALDYFETLWRQATPAEDSAPAWTPLLTLMRQGITLDSASRAVGINPRTGRRRIAAAMEHYGVSTLFALGVAWSADSSQSSDRPA
ncbi:hypothetical protein [Herbiconiux sp.]|uniref:hypothetical protein n=1 Tax=Herbiconiux sp. TaxID=1871186 RepID=UPI0025C42722|nr:hypothetical protein [Herbiconiux sp.]